MPRHRLKLTRTKISMPHFTFAKLQNPKNVMVFPIWRANVRNKKICSFLISKGQMTNDLTFTKVSFRGCWLIGGIEHFIILYTFLMKLGKIYCDHYFNHFLSTPVISRVQRPYTKASGNDLNFGNFLHANHCFLYEEKLQYWFIKEIAKEKTL